MNTSNITGLQHIGMPVKSIDNTSRFYEGLGFSVIHRTATPEGVPVIFLKLGSCVLECWQDDNTVGKAGAIDHIALDAVNIDELYADVKNAGYPITTNGIESLPFWEKGIRFFKTEGPDGESIEFCEICR